MDETEVTNSEYRQFVNWVRDSVIRRKLAVKAVEALGYDVANDAAELEEGIGMFYPLSMMTDSDPDPDMDANNKSFPTLYNNYQHRSVHKSKHHIKP